MIQVFPHLYTYSCDFIQLVYPKEIKVNEGEYYILTRGCEMTTFDKEKKKEKGNHSIFLF
jgi:hypothetical protein